VAASAIGAATVSRGQSIFTALSPAKCYL